MPAIPPTTPLIPKTLAQPATLITRPALYIDVQHGLCNRLRALASGAVIARKTGRQLIVVWRPDHHCEARISDILRYDGPVIEDAAADLLRTTSARVYNYMEVEDGAAFEEPILAQPVTGDVYIRSAYTLTGPQTTRAAETRFLKALIPSDPVLDLIAQVPHPSDVALHIRMATGPEFDHLSYEAPENWPAGRHDELIAWRQKSDISRFVTVLDQLVAEGAAQTIFVAADLPASYAALVERYGEKIRYLRRGLFDRSAVQLQYAMADLLLLTSAPLFLASTWSSFSDTAQRLARSGRRHLQSGTDF